MSTGPPTEGHWQVSTRDSKGDLREPECHREHCFLDGESFKARRVPQKGDISGLAGPGVETEAWAFSRAVATAWVGAGAEAWV